MFQNDSYNKLMGATRPDFDIIINKKKGRMRRTEEQETVEYTKIEVPKKTAHSEKRNISKDKE